MVAQILTRKSIQFPSQVKIMTEQQVKKKYHIKKLYRLSLKTSREIPQLEEKTWQRRFVGMYFAKDHKKQMPLSDRAIECEGVEISS